MEINNVNKAIEREVMRSPSPEFSKKVMDQVFAISGSKKASYSPIISRNMWFVLGSLCGVLVVIIVIFAAQNSADTPSGFSNSIQNIGIQQLTQNLALWLKQNKRIFSGAFVFSAFIILFESLAYFLQPINRK